MPRVLNYKRDGLPDGAVYAGRSLRGHAHTGWRGCLAMRGSVHDGEALNAARLADKMVREQGIKWFDVIGTTPPRASPDPPPPPPSDDDLLMQFESAYDACEFVLRSTPLLTEWERTFVLRLPGFTKLSHKQLDILRRLVMRAIAAGATP